MKVDMWYKDKRSNITKLDITFYPNECGTYPYRGNLWIGDKIVGDYMAKDWREIEDGFPHLYYDWG